MDSEIWALAPQPPVWRELTLYDRTVPTSDTDSGGEVNSLNLVFIVAFAVGIALLAQWIIRRGGRK